MAMLDVAKLDKWLNSHTEECMLCGAKKLEFAAFESGFMAAHCFACDRGINVRIDTIRTIALSDEAMEALKVMVRDKRLPMKFRAECDMVLCLVLLYRKYFGEEWPAPERKLREEEVR
jgi:hypothetical protein